MNAKKCDRCGKFYDVCDWKIQNIHLIDIGISERVDLCEEGYTELENWLESERAKERSLLTLYRNRDTMREKEVIK